MATVEFDMDEFKEFFRRLDRAAKDGFRAEFELYMEAVGYDFLRVVQDEIERLKVMDSRQLLASFQRGSSGNVWELSDGGLTLEVGTNVNYASFVNDGHWTNPKGVTRRFVPGYWQGDRFIYDPSSKSGMMLKQHWVDGTAYFESALHIYEKIFQASAEVKLQEWINRYFGG